MVSDAASAVMFSLGGFQSALRFAVVSDDRLMQTSAQSLVSIRFKVRGGFRRKTAAELSNCWVSIRFKVRGGFRRVLHCYAVEALYSFNPLEGSRWCQTVYATVKIDEKLCQSALRFAVVSD